MQGMRECYDERTNRHSFSFTIYFPKLVAPRNRRRVGVPKTEVDYHFEAHLTEKKVYPLDQLTADGGPYHKSCFKCHHCKGTLQLGSYYSFEGELYCKPRFEQLFKETGSFEKSFHSNSKPGPELTGTPSKAASMFSGTQDKCVTCSKTVYPLEKVSVEGQCYHKSCFRCHHGGCAISPSNYAAIDSILFCKHHFSQLFMEKGSYNYLTKGASMKCTESLPPDLSTGNSLCPYRTLAWHLWCTSYRAHGKRWVAKCGAHERRSGMEG